MPSSSPLAVGVRGRRIQREGEFSVAEADTGGLLLEGRYRVSANGTAVLGTLPVSRGDHRLFLLRWTALGGKRGSHYLLGTPPFSLERCKAWLPAVAALPDPFDASAVGV